MKFYEKITNLLKTHKDYLSQNGELLKTKIIDEAYSDSEVLMSLLLLRDEEIKREYFKTINNMTIFLKDKFLRMISDKHYLLDSYTAYKNKIGLMDNNGLIKESGNVVLNFPFKDCYLEGGQTQDNNDKKIEIFFNEILAKDEIDRLFDPKGFVNSKRITKDGESPLTNFTLSEDKREIKDNLLIKGNNLLALHSLEKRFAGKVKLIYIDPPYNTGNDSFSYNDSFNHSSWLVFMKNRLEIAKKLLREDGVIFVQCDDNEQAYLKVLMDEIFGRGNFCGDMIRKTKSTTNDAKVGFNIQHENTLIYSKVKSELYLQGSKKTFEKYKNPDNDPRGRWVVGDPSAPTGSYFEIVNPYTGKVDLPPENCHWRFSESTFKIYVESGKIKFKETHKENERGFIFKRYQEEIRSNFNLLNSLELCDNKYMNQVATKERNKLFGETSFSYPKPESAIQIFINASTKEGDIVLDFFAGSGTTAAVAHKMNRQWITIEQMDYIEAVTKERLKKVLEGEQGGISQSVKWTGGGDFVYMELAPFNEIYKQKILKCNNTDELVNVYKEMKEKAFLDYRYELVKALKGDKEFVDLEFEMQQKILIDILDKNQMYIPYTEIEDTTYHLSEHDIKNSKQFYGDK